MERKKPAAVYSLFFVFFFSSVRNTEVLQRNASESTQDEGRCGELQLGDTTTGFFFFFFFFIFQETFS